MTYTLSRWDLSELFSARDGEDMQAALAELERMAAAFEARRAQLSAQISVQDFLSLVTDLETIERLNNRVGAFASLSFSADTQDQAAQSFVARVDQFLTGLYNHNLFFELWWKDLDEVAAQRLLEAAGDYRYWLEQMRQFKPHTLSEPEEKVINLKNVTGVNALIRLYDSITNRYTFTLSVDGQEQEYTRGELMVFARSHDPALRAAAYQELYRIYGQDGPILGQIYQTLARDWRGEQVDLRRFAEPIAARNLANDIPDPVVDVLLDACQRNTDVFQRFFRLKARRLGMELLRRYDIYAPLAKSEKTYDFNQAAEMVLSSFGEFEPRLAVLAQRLFDQRHLDSEVRKGKRSGAFCSTVTPDLAPWVLVNYQGKAEDVATLAHELGHAIHSLLAAGHSAFTQQSSLPLAETASTFGEMLLIDRLLANESDLGVRRDLLFRQVDDAYASIQRQAYFALFERQAHEMIQAGASVDELSAAYLENLQRQFSGAVELSDEFRWEWVSIPHIYHVPFYVYAYTFGQLLVLALYRQYKIEGQAFKPRYLKILQAGGSEAPVRILSAAGIDIYQADFWQGGFDILGELVGQLEALPLEPMEE
jgi:oligoendopeptidase F